eukprot:13453205-Alexandrium_andersonii.AAC.1
MSDDDLEEVIGIAVGAAHDSDEDIAHAVEVAVAANRERFRQRGSLLCRHMRQVKAAKHAAPPLQIADHVRERIDRHN